MLLTYRALKRRALARSLRITTPNGVDESSYVRIGGLDQWISVRGEDRSNPVFLELHGGPGASNSIFTPRTRAWERHFTIVRWDMRGAGRTFAAHGPAGQGELTLDRLYADALEVTDHIRARLGVPKVVLLANSFGTVTGLRLARDHPERYSAYVGTDQNIIAGGTDSSAYDDLLARLRGAGKRRQLSRLTAMGPDPTSWSPEEWSCYARTVTTTDPLTYDTMKTVVIRSLWFSPLHTLRDLRAYLKGMTFSEQLGPQAMSLDEYAEGTTFHLPVFLFQGASDVLTPPEPARRFHDHLTAPLKDFALIPDASHFAAFRRPDVFLELLVGRVRPVVTGVGVGG
ncbi:proline iminopeptidase [Streptomyces griseofuscus]|uniref:alpha/beta fold hydrolase n=1 Tax=Streptomyces griseofuscus TaxID=146922 RepID=UPI000F6481D7|nr:alpha/beta hydrolase [Streptomyces griseofuscus]RRQ77133.1 proline iminopeptidase [Streptomyces griseofuscus]